LLANRYAYGVWNFLANGFASPVAYGVVAGSSFRNHSANSAADVLGALLAYPLASAVANGLGAALRNHLAGLVANSPLSALGNHLAGGVANRSASRLADIAANCVSDGLAAALGNHAAGRIANGSLTALGNHLANSVRNRFGYTASLVTNAVDFLGFASRNPASLADRARWALDALNSARSGAINASAAAFVPNPSSGLADNASDNRTRNFFLNGFPSAATNFNRLGVVDWGHYRSNDFTSPLFLHGNHNGVVDDLFVLLTNWLHYRIVNHSLASLVNRLTNGVVDHLFVLLIDWLHDGVVDDLLVGLNYRPHDGVLHFLGMVVVHRSANIVGHLASLGFPNWLHDCVFAGPSLINRLANRLRDGSVTGFRLHPSDVNHFVLGNRLILGSHSLNSLLFVDRTAHGPHDSVGCWIFAATCSTGAGIFVADRSEVRGLCSTGHGSQQGYQYRNDKQPSHLPFSLEN
jgi:hypothetical protein